MISIVARIAGVLLCGPMVLASAPPVVERSADDATLVTRPPSSVRLADRFTPAGAAVGRSFVIGGLGSSVGAGATLRDIARDAPVARFTRALAARVPGGSLARWTTVNGSVPGTTIHNGLTHDWGVLESTRPDVVVLAYGMNDGVPAQFELGQTFAGAMQEFASLLGEIRASGAIPVVLTSPSPHTVRTDWEVPAGPAVPQSSPVDVSSPVRDVVVPRIGVAPQSTRHAAVNEGMRRVAAAMSVDVIDVEPDWLRAVARDGEDAMFGATEFVHPNLLGHRSSYHLAIDRAVAAMTVLPASPASGVSASG